MTYITLPQENEPRRLVFFLAMEEYVASHLDELFPGKEYKEAFFLWQVEPTVIFGRNQVMEAEVNIGYCTSKGIQLFRRKSGGGCVYSDKGNIMLSYISNSTDVVFTFEKFLQRVALLLRNAGTNASVSGRNDIIVDGKKVSGNAFFKLPKSSIVHGTMLFNTDFDELTRAITPSEAKIKSKGVDSVRQHVTNLRPYFVSADSAWQRSLSDIDTFKRYIAESFCGIRDSSGKTVGIDSIELTTNQLNEISAIEAGYLDPAFLEGRKHSFTAIRDCRIDGVGEITLEMEMNAGTIAKVSMKGDYFARKEGIDQVLSEVLKGCRDTKEEFAEAVKNISLDEYIPGLKADILAEMLYHSSQSAT